MEPDEHMEEDDGWLEDNSRPEHDESELFAGVGANFDTEYGIQDIPELGYDDIDQVRRNSQQLVYQPADSCPSLLEHEFLARPQCSLATPALAIGRRRAEL